MDTAPRPFLLAVLIGSLTGTLVGGIATLYFFGPVWLVFFTYGLPPGVIAGSLALLTSNRRKMVWVVTAVLFGAFALSVTIFAFQIGLPVFALESWIWALAACFWVVSASAARAAVRSHEGR